MASLIHIPNPHAPACGHCGRPMRLASFQPDPNGGRYMYERFQCAGCGVETPHVRPLSRPVNVVVSPPISLLRGAILRAAGRLAGPSRVG
jgi:hypothetical protein